MFYYHMHIKKVSTSPWMIMFYYHMHIKKVSTSPWMIMFYYHMHIKKVSTSPWMIMFYYHMHIKKVSTSPWMMMFCHMHSKKVSTSPWMMMFYYHMHIKKGISPINPDMENLYHALFHFWLVFHRNHIRSDCNHYTKFSDACMNIGILITSFTANFDANGKGE